MYFSRILDIIAISKIVSQIKVPLSPFGRQRGICVLTSGKQVLVNGFPSSPYPHRF